MSGNPATGGRFFYATNRPPRKERTTMKCISVNNHDYATRAHGDPTANAALNKIMREQARKRPQFPRVQYSTDGRTQVIHYN